MKSNRIKNFNDFVNESYNTDVNEGFFSSLSALIKRVGGWAGSFLKAIAQGAIKPIPSGPMKGLPVAMLFLPENGSIYQQMLKFNQGTNPLSEAKIPLEYTGEDQSVRNIFADDLKDDIVKLYRSKTRGGRAKPIFIYGAPGIGKTQIVGQAGDELNVPVIKLDLQFMNPEDFLGIPSKHDIRPVQVEDGKLIDTGAGFTRSNPPRVLPQDNGKDDRGGIIFMDEMNRANKVVLNSIMQFVQQGRIQDYQLPDKWVIVAAGNRPEEAEGVADFDFALADRFTIKNYVPTVEKWTSWAEKSDKVLPELVTFLTFNKDLFHHLDADKKVLNYPTPRSWTDAAEILNDEVIDSGVSSWKDLPRDAVYNIFFDQVGPDAASKFLDYLDVLKKVTELDINKILTDPDNAKIVDEGLTQKSVLYGLMEIVMKKVESYDVQKLYNMMSYFNRYNQLDPLSWLYKAILVKFPEFRFGGASSTPEDKLKHDASLLVTSQAKQKGLQG